MRTPGVINWRFKSYHEIKTWYLPKQHVQYVPYTVKILKFYVTHFINTTRYTVIPKYDGKLKS